MTDLHTVLADLERQRASKLAEVERLDQAISGVKDAIRALEEREGPERAEFANMPLKEAAKRLLLEAGRPLKTREIADELLARGYRTRSRRFPVTVYAILQDSRELALDDHSRWVLATHAKEGPRVMLKD